MHSAPPAKCSICGSAFDAPIVIAGLRRSECHDCGHSQRIDVETFDYVNVAMGASGVDSARLDSQSDFIIPNIRSGARALEIGCAAGDLARTLRGGFEFTRYDGVEFSPSRVAASQHLDRIFDRPLAELIDAGALSHSSYDVVIASHCLEHIDDPASLIAAIATILCDDGSIFIEVPNRSGHPMLPFDDNRSHLHFFSVASLSRLLVNHGLHVVALRTGARFDARYQDSIRVIARRAPREYPGGFILSNHPSMENVGKVVIWGAGKMTDEILAYYFDPARIAFFVDRDPGKQGSHRLGAPVLAPEALRTHPRLPVLINSLEMELPIRSQIARDFGDLDIRVIGIASLLES